ncbi:ROK family protein [Streptomyces sp. NRRL WC-3742]|uniref:ROK family protein n=1 Tax=Streptomyces sp. NRRL WC-3742 TaxID=1463934 RepID=UPI00056C9096|nr:ROK family protein [Streptomyces sp. NRRL WC-3742]
MSSPVVLGFDIGGTRIAVAATDTGGTRLGSDVVSTHAERSAEGCLTRAVKAARVLMERVAPGRRPIAVGVSMRGVLGSRGGALSPNNQGWSGPAVRSRLESAFLGARVRVATDVMAAARVEAEYGSLVGADPAIYLNLGSGLAVAIVVGGEVIIGHNGLAGEVGRNLRHVSDVGRSAGDRILLEEAVGGKALMDQALRVLPGLDGARQLLSGTARHPQLSRLLEEFTGELAFHLVNLTVAVDPERIAVGGGMVRAWDILHQPLRRALGAAVPDPPDLVAADFPLNTPLLGALALGQAAARDAPTSGAVA